MIKMLEIVDGRTRKAKPCAKLYYDDSTCEFDIVIEEGLSPNDVPMMMEPFVERGQLDMGAEWSRRWVEERIPPSGRQNLGEILKAHDLEEYDEFALLRNNRGFSSQDYFVVRTPLAEEEALRAAEMDGENEGSLESGDLASVRRFRMRKQVGSLVAAARKRSGLKQHDLAQRAGVGQAVISRVETGKANATIDLLSDIAAAMDLSLLEMLTAERA